MEDGGVATLLPRLRVAAVETVPRPKVCAGNDDTAAAATDDAAAGAPLLFLFAAASLLFLAEALNIAAAKVWGARRGRRMELCRLHR